MTGSVASIKARELVEALQHRDGEDGQPRWDVRVAVTDAASHFVKATDRGAIPSDVDVFTNADEWRWKTVGDAVLHIDLRSWADVPLP